MCVYLCVPLWICACRSVGAHGVPEVVVVSSVAEIIGSCELSGVSVGNQTWLLCKNSTALHC